MTPGAPVISERSRDGLVTITHLQPLPIAYTTDGTAPTVRSPIYHAPISLAEGGMVRGGEQLIKVNERGQEFVMNAGAVDRFGENFFANLNAGHSLPAAAAASPAAPASIKNEQNVHVVMFNNEARMSEYLRSAEGQKVLVDLMQSNLHQITGKA